MDISAKPDEKSNTAVDHDMSHDINPEEQLMDYSEMQQDEALPEEAHEVMMEEYQEQPPAESNDGEMADVTSEILQADTGVDDNLSGPLSMPETNVVEESTTEYRAESHEAPVEESIHGGLNAMDHAGWSVANEEAPVAPEKENADGDEAEETYNEAWQEEIPNVEETQFPSREHAAQNHESEDVGRPDAGGEEAEEGLAYEGEEAAEEAEEEIANEGEEAEEEVNDEEGEADREVAEEEAGVEFEAEEAEAEEGERENKEADREEANEEDGEGAIQEEGHGFKEDVGEEEQHDREEANEKEGHVMKEEVVEERNSKESGEGPSQNIDRSPTDTHKQEHTTSSNVQVYTYEEDVPSQELQKQNGTAGVDGDGVGLETNPTDEAEREASASGQKEASGDHSLSNDQHYKPMPVRVTFNEQDFVMFPDAEPATYIGETESHVVAPRLAGRAEAYFEPLESLFEALRIQESLGDFLEEGTEVTLEFPALDMHVREDDVYAREVTLDDIYRLHDGLGLPSSLHVVVTEGRRFISRYNELANHVSQLMESALDAEGNAKERPADVGESQTWQEEAAHTWPEGDEAIQAEQTAGEYADEAHEQVSGPVEAYDEHGSHGMQGDETFVTVDEYTHEQPTSTSGGESQDNQGVPGRGEYNADQASLSHEHHTDTQATTNKRALDAETTYDEEYGEGLEETESKRVKVEG